MAIIDTGIKPLTIKDLEKSYAKAIKAQAKPLKRVLGHTIMRGQQVPPGKYQTPPGVPSVAFNLKLRG
jgi:hypothetical protein